MQTYRPVEDTECDVYCDIVNRYRNPHDMAFDIPPTLFPSLKLKTQRGAEEVMGADKTEPPHSLTTNCTLLLSRSEFAYSDEAPVSAQSSAPVLPVKRPVGRPRLYPKKEVDPNRIKRGYKITC